MIQRSSHRRAERGNVLFMVLIAVVLIGLLTAAIQFSSRPEGANIDRETLVIRATEAQRQAGEFERAVLFILQENGKSESELRFAHPQAHADYGDLSADADKTDQVFDRLGGGANYALPPEGINDGSSWEFYGGTDLPDVGSDKADLIAVLPNVTQKFCERINAVNGQTASQPEDTGVGAAAGSDPGSCLKIGAAGRFDGGQQFYTTTINATDEATFTLKPALEACVHCALDNAYHFYHVLLAR
jgi:hypothetical protein